MPLPASSEVSHRYDPQLTRYTNIYVGKPTVMEEFSKVPITPQQARLRDITYSAEISVDIEYSRGRVREFMAD